MKFKTIIIILVVVIIAAVSYFIGNEKGKDYCAKHSHQPPDYWEKLVQLDKLYSTFVLTPPSTMTTGTYTLETAFPGKSPEVYELNLTFSNGQLLKEYQTIGQDYVTNGFIQEGKVVYGSLYDMNERPSREYVGIINGNMMWGKVYVPRGYGWHNDPPEIGVWILCKKPEETI